MAMCRLKICSAPV